MGRRNSVILWHCLWLLVLLTPAGLGAFDPPVSVRPLRSIADIRKMTYEE